jgi:hypothetical protein
VDQNLTEGSERWLTAPGILDRRALIADGGLSGKAIIVIA